MESWVNLPMKAVVGCQIRGLGDFEKCIGWGTNLKLKTEERLLADIHFFEFIKF